MLISKFWLNIVRKGGVMKHIKVFPSFLKPENAKTKFPLLTINILVYVQNYL